LSYYLDTSVVVPIFLDEDESSTIKAWIDEATDDLHYSHLVAGELNSAISRHVREGVFSENEADAIRDAAAVWFQQQVRLIEIDDEHVEVAARAVANPDPKFLMPDAIHLAICERANLTIVTFDKDLLFIAAREGVAAIRPE
jgi:uncharacterized protein